jgi:hypothetical protein
MGYWWDYAHWLGNWYVLSSNLPFMVRGMPYYRDRMRFGDYCTIIIQKCLEKFNLDALSNSTSKH